MVTSWRWFRLPRLIYRRLDRELELSYLLVASLLQILQEIEVYICPVSMIQRVCCRNNGCKFIGQIKQLFCVFYFKCYRPIYVHYFNPGSDRREKYCDERVCHSVCLSARISMSKLHVWVLSVRKSAVWKLTRCDIARSLSEMASLGDE